MSHRIDSNKATAFSDNVFRASILPSDSRSFAASSNGTDPFPSAPIVVYRSFVEALAESANAGMKVPNSGKNKKGKGCGSSSDSEFKFICVAWQRGHKYIAPQTTPHETQPAIDVKFDGWTEIGRLPKMLDKIEDRFLTVDTSLNFFSSCVCAGAPTEYKSHIRSPDFLVRL